MPQFSLEAEKSNRDEILEEGAQTVTRRKMTVEVEKLMKQSIRRAFVIGFFSALKNNEPKTKKKQKAQQEPRKEDQLKFGEAPYEIPSTQSTIITEALYKFIRRNSALQHLNLSSCNLTQTMIGRIGSGVKCSASLMSVHFSDNPGVTIAVKSYLQVRLSAMPPKPPEADITNQWIEEGSNLE